MSPITGQPSDRSRELSLAASRAFVRGLLEEMGARGGPLQGVSVTKPLAETVSRLHQELVQLGFDLERSQIERLMGRLIQEVTATRGPGGAEVTAAKSNPLAELEEALHQTLGDSSLNRAKYTEGTLIIGGKAYPYLSDRIENPGLSIQARSETFVITTDELHPMGGRVWTIPRTDAGMLADVLEKAAEDVYPSSAVFDFVSGIRSY